MLEGLVGAGDFGLGAELVVQRVRQRQGPVDDVDGNPGPRLSDSDLTITAAIEGQGVALIDPVLVEREIAAGRLVIPFDIGLEPDFGYYVVSTTQAANRPAVKAFREWALAEAGRAGN